MQPPRDHSLDLFHLGTIYMMDPGRQGKFEQKNLIEFVNLYIASRTGERVAVDSDSKFQAYCTLRLWNDVSRPDVGVTEFVKWIVQVALRNDQIIALKGDGDPNSSAHTRITPPGGKEYVSWDSVRSIYRLLNVRQAVGHEYEAFFDLMQRAAEEQGLMTIDDARFDKLVPMPTLALFARHFITGFIAFLTELGFKPNMPLDI